MADKTIIINAQVDTGNSVQDLENLEQGIEEHWRWGYVVVESMKKPKIGTNEDGFNIYDYELVS